MDLPFDIKELIATHLGGPDLANLSRVDSEFTSLFKSAVAPTFRHEFIRISKIIPYLMRLFHFKPTSEDLREEMGEEFVMSHILGREIEEGEIYQDEIEYNLWRTMLGVTDIDPSFTRVVEEYKYNTNVMWVDTLDGRNMLDHYFDQVMNEIPFDHF
jgi:hypothetical protein